MRLAILMVVVFQGMACAEAKQGCLPSGRIVSTRGRLEQVNEGGYRRWVALRPVTPVCTLADPANQLSSSHEHVDVLQAVVIENDAVGSRLNRLTGKNALVSGTITEWGTGYQRAQVVFQVQRVDSTDAAGEAALLAPVAPKPSPRVVAAYEVTVLAGRRLTKEAREVGPKELLVPVDEYAPHWVTGGDVVYVHCRDGYDVQFVSGSMAEDNALCGLAGNSCGFGIPRRGTIRLRMRCTTTP